MPDTLVADPQHTERTAVARNSLGDRLSRVLRGGEPAAVIVLLLIAWELTSRSGLLSHEDFPPASTVLHALIAELGTPSLWSNLWVSLGAWLTGMVIIVVVGVPAGMLLGSSELAYSASHLTVEFVRTLPGIAALPLLMFIYGVGFELTVMLIVLTAIWAIIIQAMYGMRDVDPIATASGRIYGLNRVRIFMSISLPSCMPYIATGLRIAGTLSLIMAIAASLVAGGDGLGAQMATAARNGDTPTLYALVLLTGFLGCAVTWALATLERRTLRWHQSQREVQS